MRNYLVSRYGYSNYQYFVFLQRVIKILSILGIIGLLPQLTHWEYSKITIDSLLITSYYLPEKLYLLGSGLIQMVVIMLTAINAKHDRYQIYPELHKASIVNDKIPKRHLRGKFFKSIKRFISYIVFAIIVAVVVVVSFFIETLPKDFLTQDKSAVATASFKDQQTILLAAFIILIHLQANAICHALTQFEDHSTWSTYQQQYFVKVLCLKVSSSLASFLGISFLSVDRKSSIQCTIPDYSIILIVFSYCVKYLEIIVLFIAYKLKILKAKPKFDIANEFADSIHKCFLVFATFFGFPTLGIFAAAISIVHYFGLILSLKYFYDKPRQYSLSMMPLVDQTFCYVCWISLISSRMAVVPATVEVYLNNTCLQS
eukprot:NODE_298_length_10484_cov_0.802600.p5 type:complete len:372 gc:universal NODE_298_length_10484_cov_0.802600:5534-6649(+)